MTYTPPPYGAAPQKKGTNPLVWIFVAIGAFCCIAIIAIGGMMTAMMGQVKDLTPCIFTNTYLAQSLEQYVKEKGVYPPADKWQSELASYYIKNSKEITEEMKDAPGVFKDFGKVAPITGPMACSTTGTMTFISYNSEIAGKKPAEITDQTTVTFFEDTVNQMNASAPFKPKDFSSSPRMMGQPRGWYAMQVDGDMQTRDASGKVKPVDISTGN